MFRNPLYYLLLFVPVAKLIGDASEELAVVALMIPSFFDVAIQPPA
jgi:hypothetical protein